ALRRNSKDGMALTNLVVSHLTDENFELAAQEAEQARTTLGDATPWQLIANEAAAWLKLGNPSKAQDILRTLNEADARRPECVEPRVNVLLTSTPGFDQLSSDIASIAQQAPTLAQQLDEKIRALGRGVVNSWYLADEP